jgi:hypothetical protein
MKWRLKEQYKESMKHKIENTNKIDKPLAKLIKRNKDKTQINKIRDKKGVL